jgi:hypothetical protein
MVQPAWARSPRLIAAVAQFAWLQRSMSCWVWGSESETRRCLDLTEVVGSSSTQGGGEPIS